MEQKSSWCIVALPEESNPVHKVSSEKMAHLTLLFLGEQSEPALAIRIIEAIQHTMKTSFSTKFSLGVERRGTLGQDQADVLFFYKDETGRVRDFRSLLLKNDDIKRCYDSAFQYPEWTPHLTLGYPDRPANPIPEDNHLISWVTFDRLSLWLEDSDGPEFRLGSYDPTVESVEHADRTDRMIQKGRTAMGEAEDFLEHYGVKGMKWGITKKTPPSKKKTLGQKLNQSKFGEISRENSKRYNAKVKAAKSLSPEEQARKQKIQKVVTIGEIAGTATVMAGAAYLQYLLRQGTN